MDSERPSRLRRTVYLRYLMAFAGSALLIFVSAGTIAYWQGWAFLACVFGPMFFTLQYFLRRDSAVLERRMKTREREGVQKAIVAVMGFFTLAGIVVAGLDARFGWSAVPAAVVLAADAAVLIGYSVFFFTMRENAYAARVVEVEQGQRVIDTGPYAVVRHPLYLGAILLYLATPIALGSYWAVPAFVPIVPLMVMRIRNEEQVLLRDLVGYAEYRRKTRYRLVPWIW
jgi:protein-S-isoprenylcysteine O-methyltransferase Ste14